MGTKFPRQHIVGKRHVEDLLQPLTQPRIRDRDDRLDTTVEIARHQVRRAEVVRGPPPVAEREDARMLEELADDRADANALRETWHARSQRAHAADEKIDLGAGLRGRVQRVDYLLVDQVVDLDDDPAPDHALSLDQLNDARAQVGRRDEMRAVAALSDVFG